MSQSSIHSLMLVICVGVLVMTNTYVTSLLSVIKYSVSIIWLYQLTKLIRSNQLKSRLSDP